MSKQDGELSWAAGLAEGAASGVFSEVSVSKLLFLEGISAVLVTHT